MLSKSQTKIVKALNSVPSKAFGHIPTPQERREMFQQQKGNQKNGNA